MSRLEEIIAHKREEIQPWIPHAEEWKRRAGHLHFRGFRKRLEKSDFGFVAEVKKASPSAGVIAHEFNPAGIAAAYDEAGADCISVLTDERYFQGHLDYLALIRKGVQRPLLRKDFTLHEVQIYQAALAGADAVLLIVAALTEEELRHFINVAREIGIDYLTEVHDEQELDTALEAGATFLGINNRDLTTFETDLSVTEYLARNIPEDCYVLSESGIRTHGDVVRVAQAGVDGVLVGEALMRARNPGRLLLEFRSAAQVRTLPEA